MVKPLNLKSFKKHIVVNRETCLVKFYSLLCPLCLALGPVYEQIAEEHGDKLKFYKVDVNEEEELTKIMNFDGVPTLYLFIDGRYHEVPFPYENPHDLTGYYKDDIIDFINKKVS